MGGSVRSLIHTFCICIAFVAGCLAAASRSLVPPAAAQAPPDARRWEYYCFVENDVEAITKLANQLGAQWWELASAATPVNDHPRWCFKRPLP